MNVQRLVTDLLAAGMTQTAIAEAIGIDQSAVSRLANGERSRVSYEVGERLLAAHEMLRAKRGRK